MAKQETNINRDIRASEVRVVDPDGEQLGIMPIDQALAAAAENGLDLVEVSPQAKPPVCRIMDYGKFKYQQQKRAAEAKKKTARVEIKEVKLRPKTETHDFDVKVKNVRRFIESGNKVKVTIMFRGREVTHPQFGRDLLQRVSEEVSDIGTVESFPSMRGRFMHMVMAPKK
ncbi:MAG: translation initiation factor IF-3 [Desulfuromonadaceae bacterium]|nr:translation initiation factor IF-3 [Geobacteraceae bacterium]